MVRLALNTQHTRRCEKCGTYKRPLFRHHKGNDGLLGRFNKRIKRGYDKFLDCVDLCLRCHASIHWLYDVELMEDWLDFTPRGANHMRQQCIDLCDKWLAGEISAEDMPDHYIEEFRASWVVGETIND